MSPIILAVLAGAAQASAQASDLSGLFQATCLDGQSRLSADEVTPISFDQLPSALRGSLGRPASGKVWQLKAAGRSYLYVLDYQGGPGTSSKICGLASDTMDLKSAADALELRMTGAVDQRNTRTAQWLNAKDGYVATATTVATFNVLQVGWMSDADRAAVLAQVNQIQQ